MSFKPLSQASATATPNTLNNSTYVYMPVNLSTLVTVADASNNTIGTLIAPPTPAGQIIIQKRPTDLLSTNTSVTCTGGSVYGTDKIPILKLLSQYAVVNSTSFTTVNNAKTFTITTVTSSLITFNDSSNTTYASIALPANTIAVLVKRDLDVLTANATVYATKVGTLY